MKFNHLDTASLYVGTQHENLRHEALAKYTHPRRCVAENWIRTEPRHSILLTKDEETHLRGDEFRRGRTDRRANVQAQRLECASDVNWCHYSTKRNRVPSLPRCGSYADLHKMTSRDHHCENGQETSNKGWICCQVVRPPKNTQAHNLYTCNI